MDEIGRVKIFLKQWEAAFQRQNGRKPNKEDILSAPSDVAESYKQYSLLRTSLSLCASRSLNSSTLALSAAGDCSSNMSAIAPNTTLKINNSVHSLASGTSAVLNSHERQKFNSYVCPDISAHDHESKLLISGQSQIEFDAHCGKPSDLSAVVITGSGRDNLSTTHEGMQSLLDGNECTLNSGDVKKCRISTEGETPIIRNSQLISVVTDNVWGKKLNKDSCSKNQSCESGRFAATELDSTESSEWFRSWSGKLEKNVNVHKNMPKMSGELLRKSWNHMSELRKDAESNNYNEKGLTKFLEKDFCRPTVLKSSSLLPDTTNSGSSIVSPSSDNLSESVSYMPSMGKSSTQSKVFVRSKLLSGRICRSDFADMKVSSDGILEPKILKTLSSKTSELASKSSSSEVMESNFENVSTKVVNPKISAVDDTSYRIKHVKSSAGFEIDSESDNPCSNFVKPYNDCNGKGADSDKATILRQNTKSISSLIFKEFFIKSEIVENSIQLSADVCSNSFASFGITNEMSSVESNSVPVESEKRTLTKTRCTKYSGRNKLKEQNYIRLNMKVRRYTRGGRTARSVSWHKRNNRQLRFKQQYTNAKLSGEIDIEKEVGMVSRKRVHRDVDHVEQDNKCLTGADVDYTEESSIFEADTLNELVFDNSLDSKAPVGYHSMEPLYTVNSDETIPDAPAEVLSALKALGFSSFRKGQERAVMRILCGLSTLVVLSTGAGKSLIYQLAAYMYAQRYASVALIVSPLVSLMEDQVTGLQSCVKGDCLHANLTASQKASVIDRVVRGDIHFLLLSPEMLLGSLNGNGGDSLDLRRLPPVSFACIDEVHCVSEWSHHFRPSYLTLCKKLRECCGVKCLLGLTATASKTATLNIANHLGIPTHLVGDALIRDASIPSNLRLTVSRDESRDMALLELLRGNIFSLLDSIIVYCTRREETVRVASLIRTCLNNAKELAVRVKSATCNAMTTADETRPGSTLSRTDRTSYSRSTVRRRTLSKNSTQPDFFIAESYHAGLPAAERMRVQSAFMSGKLRIIIATVAFGMGIDKDNVRGIIHYNQPRSVESYVQEIGRAGRDGQPSYCHLFLGGQTEDLNEIRRHIYARTVDRVTVKRLVQQIFEPCQCLHKISDKQELKMQQITHDFESGKTEYKLQPQENQSNYCMQHISSSKLDKNTCPVNNCNMPTPDINQSCVNQDKLMHDAEDICPGHLRTLNIDEAVRRLDMTEEGISTLLCYLELHPSKYLKTKQSVFASCTLSGYDNPSQLKAAAKQCLPLATILSLKKIIGLTNRTFLRTLTFSVAELCNTLGREMNVIKRDLKQLEWRSGQNGWKKTGLVVKFHDLCLAVIARGDLHAEQLDELVSFLSDRVEAQELSELFNLREFWNILHSVSYKSCYGCIDAVDELRSNKLKKNLQKHLECHTPAMQQSGLNIAPLLFTREYEARLEYETIGDRHEPLPPDLEGAVRADIISFISIYSADHGPFTGRAIARIFHGIESPNYPSSAWGRARRFWRRHISINFNVLRRIATDIIVSGGH